MCGAHAASDVVAQKTRDDEPIEDRCGGVVQCGGPNLHADHVDGRRGFPEPHAKML